MKLRTVDVTLTPAIDPVERGGIADAVAGALGPTASIVDEGTVVVPPTRSELTIEVQSDSPPDEIAHDVWAVLAGLDVNNAHTLSVTVDRQPFSRPLH